MMKVIEMGQKVVKEIDEKLPDRVISAVVYGKDIGMEVEKANDCNLLLVLDKIEPKTAKEIKNILMDEATDCVHSPLLVEKEEIEGMMDSVPVSFLNIMLSYQTIFGESLFKGLSSLNHEHLRAQTEQMLRESLFSARLCMMKCLGNREEMIDQIERMRLMLDRSIKVYHILKKPWLTEEEEHWESFLSEFPPDNLEFKQFHGADLSSLDEEDLMKYGFSLMDDGIKPLLKKVDELGP